MNKIAIIGVGSAGIQALCHYCAWLDDWEITSIHQPNIPIVGIGESTNPPFLDSIMKGLLFDHNKDLEQLDATIKLGTKYVNWREHEFNNPFIGGNLAIHMNTFKLKEFAFARLKDMWGDKFSVIEGNVDSLHNTDNKAVVVVDGKPVEFDYVMDCRGFPKDYTNYTVFENAPLNRGLVHNGPVVKDLIYTLHEATPDGWMFGVPLSNRMSYGYMFNDNITDIDTARENFSKQIGVTALDNTEYKFKYFYSNNILDGRIIKNGNSAFFYEPMFANSLFVYDRINRYFYEYMFGTKSDVMVDYDFNRIANEIHEIICLHYSGGSTFDTPFWTHAKQYGRNVLDKSINYFIFRDVISQFEKNKSWIRYENYRWAGFSLQNLLSIQTNMGL